MMEIKVDKLVQTYIKIRDKRAELAKQDSALGEQLDIIEAGLLETFKELGADSLSTPYGTVSRRISRRYWTTDWASFYQFLKEHDAVELLEKRIAQSNIRQFLEENPDLLPPGLNVDSRYTASVRRK
jgi:hypothetical protein